MKKFQIIFVLLLICGFPNTTLSQINGDYRSSPGPFSGNWSQSASWQTYNGSNWVSAGSSPNISNIVNTITILAGHSITLDISPNVPNLIIEATGKIKNTSSSEYGIILWGNLTVNGTLGGQSNNIAVALNNSSSGTSIISGTGLIGLLYFTKTDGTSTRTLDIQSSITLYDSDPFKNNSGNTLTIDHTIGTLELPNSNSLSSTNIIYDFNGTSNTVKLSSSILTTQYIYSSGSTVYKNLTFAGSGTKSLSGNIEINGSLTFEGDLTFNTNGNTITYSNTASLVYSGSFSHTTGDEWGSVSDIQLGSNINNLIINNSSGIILDKNGIVDGTVYFTNGSITTGSNILTLGSTGSFDSAENSGNQLIGNVSVTRDISANTVETFGNIGIKTDGSNPETLSNVNIIRVSGDAGISNIGGNESIKRKWIVSSGSGALQCCLTIQWAQNEDNGKDPSRMELWNKVEGSWSKIGNTITDASSSPRSFKTNITSLSGTYTGSDDLNALPVELTYFSSTIFENEIVLEWETATEINNYGFIVERNSSDSIDIWKELDFIPGNGNSNSPKSYSYIDANFPPNILKYRLKQIDTDGISKYYYSSDSVDAKFLLTDIEEVNLNQNYRLEQNFPNPFNPSTKINFSIPLAGYVTLKVYNTLGKEVAVLINQNIDAGYHSVSFDGSELSSGVYFYKLHTTNGFTMTKKLMLLK